MGLLTFKGGIHPDDGKRFSKDQPIKALLPTGDLIYPLSQHIGAPAAAGSQVGEHNLQICPAISVNTRLRYIPEHKGSAGS